MSDVALSQEELDTLLMSDPPASGSPAQPQGGDSSLLGDAEKNAVLSLLGEVVGSQSATLSGIIQKNVSISAPVLDVVSQDSFLSSLPEEVLQVSVNFNSGVAGYHVYILNSSDSLKIAAPMIGQDDLEPNDMVINVVNEAMSNITGSSVTVIGDKISENIMADAPEGKILPKALLEFPGDNFVSVTYDLEIEGQGSLKLYEIFSLDLIKAIVSKMGVAQQPAGSAQVPPATGMGGMNMGQPAGQAQMNAAAQGGMFQQMPSNMGAPMMGGFGSTQPPPNVQGVQLPELQPSMSAGEQRNIGLLMDVSMELTVELGRTKWKIKDILGIGEGTIIELDKLAGEKVDILVNNNLIARGEVVVIDENFGVRVTEIVSKMDRMSEQ